MQRSYQPYFNERTPDWPSDIDSNKPVDIEIGCGVGLHPIKYCSSHPDRQLIAIEHTAAKFSKMIRRKDRHQLDNLFCIHGNGIAFLAKHGRQNSLDQAFLLYPNPNPKPNHQNKRWHAMPFMGHLWSCLKPGGLVTLVTNEKWYFEEALQFFKEEWNFPVENAFSFTQEDLSLSQQRTHFERKYLGAGQTCYEIHLRK